MTFEWPTICVTMMMPSPSDAEHSALKSAPAVLRSGRCEKSKCTGDTAPIPTREVQMTVVPSLTTTADEAVGTAEKLTVK